jgi:hypothetical protein
VKPYGVVWIDICELNATACVHNVDGRNRQLMMFLARCCFEIYAVTLHLCKSLLINFIGNPECPRRHHMAIRQKMRFEVILDLGFHHSRNGLRSDSEPLETRLFNFRLDFAQLTQLLLTVWSPTSTVENENGWSPPYSLV